MSDNATDMFARERVIDSYENECERMCREIQVVKDKLKAVTDELKATTNEKDEYRSIIERIRKIPRTCNLEAMFCVYACKIIDDAVKSETYERKWLRLGFQVDWSEVKPRAYEIKHGKDVLARFRTVQEVDRWITNAVAKTEE